MSEQLTSGQLAARRDYEGRVAEEAQRILDENPNRSSDAAWAVAHRRVSGDKIRDANSVRMEAEMHRNACAKRCTCTSPRTL